MKMLILPTLLALALMSGGAVLAADLSDSDNAYLYVQPSPLAVPQDELDSDSTATLPDQGLDPASQRASTNGSVLMAQSSSLSAMAADNPTDEDPRDIQGPE